MVNRIWHVEALKASPPWRWPCSKTLTTSLFSAGYCSAYQPEVQAPLSGVFSTQSTCTLESMWSKAVARHHYGWLFMRRHWHLQGGWRFSYFRVTLNPLKKCKEHQEAVHSSHRTSEKHLMPARINENRALRPGLLWNALRLPSDICEIWARTVKLLWILRAIAGKHAIEIIPGFLYSKCQQSTISTITEELKTFLLVFIILANHHTISLNVKVLQ